MTSILPDFTRRCPVVDPDDHHLFVSLGCAAENLIQAAQANGLNSQCAFYAAHGTEAGRCYQRFGLQATALGIRSAFLNQPVELAAMRAQFAAFLGIGHRRPDLVLRFWRGPRMPSSLRRPVDAVMTDAHARVAIAR